MGIDYFDGSVGGDPVKAAGLSGFPNDRDGFLWGWDWDVVRNVPWCALDQPGELAGILDAVWCCHDGGVVPLACLGVSSVVSAALQGPENPKFRVDGRLWGRVVLGQPP
jgi:hypothetical protein